jgi:single-strand DNA-binding protein
MPALNRVFLMGNLTRDPEMRQTNSGLAICSFRIAMNRKFRSADGQDREEVCFVDIDTFARQAETCHRYLSKGRPVLVDGRLQMDEWEDRESGRKMSRLKVIGERVQFLGGGGGGGGGDGDSGGRSGGGRSQGRPSQGGGNSARESQADYGSQADDHAGDDYDPEF